MPLLSLIPLKIITLQLHDLLFIVKSVNIIITIQLHIYLLFNVFLLSFIVLCFFFVIFAVCMNRFALHYNRIAINC